MNSSQLRRKSFIIRIWIETREIETEATIWRGTIEEVNEGIGNSSENRQSHTPLRMAYTRISDMIDFLKQRMKQLGIPDDQIDPQ